MIIERVEQVILDQYTKYSVHNIGLLKDYDIIRTNVLIISRSGEICMRRKEQLAYIMKALKKASDREIEIIYGLVLGLIGAKV